MISAGTAKPKNFGNDGIEGLTNLQTGTMKPRAFSSKRPMGAKRQRILNAQKAQGMPPLPKKSDPQGKPNL